jgi:DHA1 family tetracycline resistance protein-like MFS transporter
MQSPKDRQLFVIVLTIFLDLLGMSLIIPIAAPLFLNSDALLVGAGVSLQYRTLILGLLLGAGPVVQFFLAPLLGAYADRAGRKPVLMFSVLINALGHALFGLGILTQQLWLLFASRALAGAGAANLAAANSAVADISRPEDKVRNFGLTGMALGVGLIFGPFLGGILSSPAVVHWFNLATPLWVAAIMAVMNAGVVKLFFRETLREPIHNHMTIWTGAHNVVKAFTMPSLRAVYISSFLLGFGFNFFAQFFSVFLVARFNFGSTQIGFLFAYLGIWLAFTQGLLTRYVSRRFSPWSVLRWAPLAAVGSFVLLAGVHRVSTIYLLLPLVALTYGLNPPNMTTVISDFADPESQGEALGIDRAMAALSFGLPPILSGWAVGLDVSMPMMFAAAFIFAAWLIFIRARIHAAPPVFHEVS